ncbi:hypothetical protein EVAR_83911_1 [Eumeta japonica]|uniref:Uncharacterized protein n=1 Tax=Eumeta variegata TaxID=151549 RepID=A0A4C1URQ9_EUMVA|nr:hypothetical protein EVAR_83911_1 [Eumeta japonica]
MQKRLKEIRSANLTRRIGKITDDRNRHSTTAVPVPRLRLRRVMREAIMMVEDIPPSTMSSKVSKAKTPPPFGAYVILEWPLSDVEKKSSTVLQILKPRTCTRTRTNARTKHTHTNTRAPTRTHARTHIQTSKFSPVSKTTYLTIDKHELDGHVEGSVLKKHFREISDDTSHQRLGGHRRPSTLATRERPSLRYLGTSRTSDGGRNGLMKGEYSARMRCLFRLADPFMLFRISRTLIVSLYNRDYEFSSFKIKCYVRGNIMSIVLEKSITKNLAGAGLRQSYPHGREIQE